mmetsp:Transcript_7587/g.19631  ORF Transcript_7587/g.19631 Transcript_7587/m.19631 type:complete len:100 (-) Transcript_7587:3175-3474(-)
MSGSKETQEVFFFHTLSVMAGICVCWLPYLHFVALSGVIGRLQNGVDRLVEAGVLPFLSSSCVECPSLWERCCSPLLQIVSELSRHGKWARESFVIFVY